MVERRNAEARRRRRDDDSAELSELLARSRAGDSRAGGELVEACTPMVRAVVRRHVGNPSDVDDAVQDVWLSFALHGDRIVSSGSLRAWLVRVAVRAAWKATRQSSRAVLLDDMVSWPDDDDVETQVADRLERDDLVDRLRDALAVLRPEDRRLLALLSAEDRPDYRAIADTVGRPVGSIGPTRQRALSRLRRQSCIRRLADPPAA